LVVLAEKASRRKGRKEAKVELADAYKESIASLERHLDDLEQFVKLYESKLRKWNSFIEELHKAHFVSNKEGDEAETGTKTKEKAVE
jgi:hypothetical protein